MDLSNYATTSDLGGKQNKLQYYYEYDSVAGIEHNKEIDLDAGNAKVIFGDDTQITIDTLSLESDSAFISTNSELEISAKQGCTIGTQGGDITITANTGGDLNLAGYYIGISSKDGDLEAKVNQNYNVNITTEDGKALYNNKEIATVADLESKQDKLQLYTEDSGFAQIVTTSGATLLAQHGTLMIDAQDGQVMIASESLVQIRAQEATYNGSEIATVDNLLIAPTAIEISGNLSKVSITTTPSNACKGVSWYCDTDGFTIYPDGTIKNSSGMIPLSITVTAYSVLDPSVSATQLISNI